MRRHILMGFLILILALAGCGNDNNESDISLESLPAGSSERGAEIFSQKINGATACSDCHMVTFEDNVGPGLEGISQRGSERVQGQSAEAYIFTSIVRPGEYVVNGYANLMYAFYEKKLAAQDIADLIAYLLTL